MIMSTWIETPRLVIRTFEPRDAEALERRGYLLGCGTVTVQLTFGFTPT